MFYQIILSFEKLEGLFVGFRSYLDLVGESGCVASPLVRSCWLNLFVVSVSGMLALVVGSASCLVFVPAKGPPFVSLNCFCAISNDFSNLNTSPLCTSLFFRSLAASAA